MTVRIALDSCGEWLRVEHLGDFRFVLAHLYEKDERYRKHFMERQSELLVVDNSAYELGESMDIAKYKEIVYEVAHWTKNLVYVLPDKLKDPFATLEMSMGFDIEVGEPMFVCQTTSPMLCKDMWKQVGTKWVGLPIWVAREYPRGRVNLAKALPEWVNIHLLGLDRIAELRWFDRSVYVDTSLPLTLAKNRRYVEDVVPEIEYHLDRIRCDDAPDYWTLELAAYHVRALKCYVRTGRYEVGCDAQV